MTTPAPAPPTGQAKPPWLIPLLSSLGWRLLAAQEAHALRGSTREVLMIHRLVEVLQARRYEYKGQAYPLSSSAVEQIVRELCAVSLTDGVLAANERLYTRLVSGITVTEFMPDGKRHQPTIAVIDWSDPAANCWDLVEDMPVLTAQGTQHRAPGLVGFVNGLPLVVIEADDTAQFGVQRHLRNQRIDEIPALYIRAQMLLALDGQHGRYGATGTAAHLWAPWREEPPDESNDNITTAVPVPVPTPQVIGQRGAATLVTGLLAPQRLLELVRSYTLFDRRAGRVVARPAQYFAVKAMLARIRRTGPDGARQGGVIWHAAGAGKSLTMVFLSRALQWEHGLAQCRVIVVTDRVALESQLTRNFATAGAFGTAAASARQGDTSRARTGRELARRIGHGAQRILFTLVHKFNTASRLAECRNDSPDVVVLVDEGHRSHGGLAHSRMRRALPRAACIAFTGTPLLHDDQTVRTFGPVIHAYTMRHAVDDGLVLPLLYEERAPVLAVGQAADDWFAQATRGMQPAQRAAAARELASLPTIHGAHTRIALIAQDVARHYSQQVRASGAGLKAQLATASKLDAIRYQRALQAIGTVSCAVVMSAPDAPEGESALDEPAMAEVRQWWREHVVQRGLDAHSHEQRVLADYASAGAPELLIVVDKLLTGFDEPRNAVLYIDKPMKAHTLIQAIARVNRLHEGKPHGLLIDYRGILRELDDTVRAYQALESRARADRLVPDATRTEATSPPAPAKPAAPVAPAAVPHAWPAPVELDAALMGLEVREPRHAYRVEWLAGQPAALGANGSANGSATTSAATSANGSSLASVHRHEAVIHVPAPATGPAASFSSMLRAAVRQTQAQFDHQADAAARVRPARLPYAPRIPLQATSDHELDALAHDALATARALLAEHSLNPANAESAIRRALLPRLYQRLGMDDARRALDEVIRHALASPAGPFR